MKKILMMLFNVAILISCNGNNPESSKQKYNDLYFSIDKKTHTAYVCRETRDSTNYNQLSSHVVIPDSLCVDDIVYKVVGIEDYAFSYCKSIDIIEIPESVTQIGYSAFNECTHLRKVSLSDSITYIGSRAFYMCMSLEEFNIPKKVSMIKERTFGYCSKLKQIEFHENISSIEKFAFTYCDGLKLVINHAKDPQKYDSIFWGTILSNITLKVPGESIDLYRDEKGWENFGTILPIEEEGTNT